jgi:hypothetical protein
MNYTRACWNHTWACVLKIERILAKINLKMYMDACEFHLQMCHFHTLECLRHAWNNLLIYFPNIHIHIVTKKIKITPIHITNPNSRPSDKNNKQKKTKIFSGFPLYFFFILLLSEWEKWGKEKSEHINSHYHWGHWLH